MTLLIISLFISVTVTGILFIIFIRSPVTGTRNDTDEIQIYKSQLIDIENELIRNSLDPDSAERMRIEIYRRMIAADKQRGNQSKLTHAPRIANIYLLLMLTVALIPGSILFHRVFEFHDLPDMPINTRLTYAQDLYLNRPTQDEYLATTQDTKQNESDKDPVLNNLVAELRNALETHSDNIEGFGLLAHNEAKLGNYNKAADAQIKLLELIQDKATSDDYLRLAEYQIYATQGYVSPESEKALRSTLSLDPENPLAKYYLGTLYMQTARPDITYIIWSDIVHSENSNSSITSAIERQLTNVALLAGIDPALANNDFISSRVNDIEAITSLPAEEQQELINQMVKNLDQRLQTEGGSAEEYAQLIISLSVLNQNDRANQVRDFALKFFANDRQATSIIVNAASKAGL